MNRYTKLAMAAALALPFTLLGQEQTTTTRTTTTVIRTAPPAPMTEAVPADRPYSEAVWIPGFYTWSGSAYVWTPGHWDRPPAQMHVWVPGHWDDRDGAWVWTPGHWSAD